MLLKRRTAKPSPGKAKVTSSGKKYGDDTVHAAASIDMLKSADKGRQTEAMEAESAMLRYDENNVGMSPDYLRTAFGEAAIPGDGTYTDDDGDHTLQYSAVTHTVDGETRGNRFDYQVLDTNTETGEQTIRSYSIMDSAYISSENGYERTVHSQSKEAFTSLNGNKYVIRNTGERTLDEGETPETHFEDVRPETYRTRARKPIA